ncbi:CPBP family glutamic-type intramembrane protease [Haloarculaceae archaeon H-GB2-1]|nr:CPBP family glutamic-type intramembrane protease [Haloarculaceae archaeon H-GB11]MEA5408308.1 CPBP family glutamic-type intramembrane protease [Haloarculaceae archaeon H-GB2-1]
MAESSVLHRIRALPASDLWGYLLFSHGWTWAWWAVNIVGGFEAFGAGLPFTIIGGAGPFLGGVVMSYVTYGRAGVSDLWNRLTEIRRISLRWGVLAIAFFPLLAVLTGTIAVLTTDATFVLGVGELRSLLADPSAFVVTLLTLLVVGPLPEEIGWRGFLLDRCQNRWSALTSGFTVGLVWAAWHAPCF